MTRGKRLGFVLVAAAIASLPVGAQECDEDTQLEADPDEDGLPDVVERFFGTDPLGPDTDLDGVNDGVEVLELRTDPLQPDSDGDGWCDGGATVIGACSAGEDLNGDGFIGKDETDPVCQIDPAQGAQAMTVRGSTLGCGASPPGGPLSLLLCLAVALCARRLRRAAQP